MNVVIQTSRDFFICIWIIVQLYDLLHGDQLEVRAHPQLPVPMEVFTHMLEREMRVH